MPSFFVTFTAVLIGTIAVSYPFFFKDLLFETVGVGRVIQDLSEFPYTCRRITHPRMEGCEDMWLDAEQRLLYAACAPALSRVAWTPSMSYLNASRRTGEDHVAVLDIDNPGADGLFGLRELKLSGYTGAAGTQSIDLHGFDVEVVDKNTLRFFMVNHRPATDESGTLFLNAKDVGANSTVDIFEVGRGKTATEMKWVRTVSDAAIYTPNRLALTGDGGFVISNDKSGKVGIRRELFPLHGGGDVAYCPPAGKGPCHKASGKTRFVYPNGLTRGADGHIYVPSSFQGKIWVFELQEPAAPDGQKSLKLLDIIKTGYPIDNLYPDPSGDLYGAAFPSALKFVASAANPYRVDAPSTVLRIRKVKNEVKDEYVVEKVVEDRAATVLGGATVAVHDAKTGRLFLGGNFAPYISVCERK